MPIRFVTAVAIVTTLTTLRLEPAAAQAAAGSVKFTTTEELQGCTIAKYLGIVTSAPPIGGDRASSQKDYPKTYSAALAALGDQAAALGANWVLKVEFTLVYGYDRDGPATGHFPQRLAAVGTAVKANCP